MNNFQKRIEEVMIGIKVTIEQFEEMVSEHDLTYDYSDDPGVWTRGTTSLGNIKQAMGFLPRNECVAIWNKYVDEKLVEGVRPQFHWRE